MSVREQFTIRLGGPDRTGFIATLCTALDRLGGTITDARIGRLHGQIAGVLVAEVRSGGRDDLEQALANLSDWGIRYEIRALRLEEERETRPFIMTYRGGDRPGLLHALGARLTALSCDYTSVRVDAVTEGGIKDYVLTCDIEAPMRVTRQSLESMVAEVGERFGVALLVLPADLDDLLP